MKRHPFFAMGTDWTILVEDCRAEALVQAELLVRDIEARLSRFSGSSAVSHLDRDREVSDPVLATVLREAMIFQRDTGGAFDPRLGAQLASLGYDRTLDDVSPASTRFLVESTRFLRDISPSTRETFRGSPEDLEELEVIVEGDHVRLEGPGSVDLGGIAKGWTVDRVIDHLLEAGADAILVDGGGDIAVRGEWPIGVGDDLSITLRDGAVATSSTCVRRWRSSHGSWFHHVLCPRTGLPAESPIDTVTVVAPNATTADALATAALVDPSGQLPRLSSPGHQAAMRSPSGAWYTTPNWSATP